PKMPPPDVPRMRILCGIVGVSGFAVLSLEVAWTRLFSLILGSSTYSLGCVLASCLSGLFLGAVLAARFAPGRCMQRPYNRLGLPQDVLSQIGTLCALGALAIGCSLFAIERVPLWLIELQKVFAGQSFASYLIPRAVLSFGLVLPQWIFPGAILPLALAAGASTERTAAARHTGWLLYFSTIGSVGGAIAAGLWLIPKGTILADISFVFSRASGIQNTIVVVILVELILAVVVLKLCLAADKKRGQHSAGLLPIVVVCVMAFLCVAERPDWKTALMTSGVAFLSQADEGAVPTDRLLPALKSDVLFYKEGMNTTVTVSKIDRQKLLLLKNDGKIEAALPESLANPSPNSDRNTQVLLGALPAIVHVSDKAKAFIVGLGSGTTLGAVVQSGRVNQAIVAELEPAVFDAEKYFRNVNGDPLRNAFLKAQTVVPVSADARNILSMYPNSSLDIIVSQPAEPWISGSSDLYSSEFWQLTRSKLAEHGVFCQWVQLYAIDTRALAVLIRTFVSAYPNASAVHSERSGELILIAFKNSADRLDRSNLEKRLKDKRLSDQFASIGIQSAEQLLKCVIADSKYLSEFCAREGTPSDLNTDNNMRLEYSLPPALRTAGDTIEHNLAALGRHQKAL
ncbi:MAG: hypothetical protein ACRD3W_02750, partial [Terriglobales bacterium]